MNYVVLNSTIIGDQDLWIVFYHERAILQRRAWDSICLENNPNDWKTDAVCCDSLDYDGFAM